MTCVADQSYWDIQFRKCVLNEHVDVLLKLLMLLRSLLKNAFCSMLLLSYPAIVLFCPVLLCPALLCPVLLCPVFSNAHWDSIPFLWAKLYHVTINTELMIMRKCQSYSIFHHSDAKAVYALLILQFQHFMYHSFYIYIRHPALYLFILVSHVISSTALQERWCNVANRILYFRSLMS